MSRNRGGEPFHPPKPPQRAQKPQKCNDSSALLCTLRFLWLLPIRAPFLAALAASCSPATPSPETEADWSAVPEGHVDAGPLRIDKAFCEGPGQGWFNSSDEADGGGRYPYVACGDGGFRVPAGTVEVEPRARLEREPPRYRSVPIAVAWIIIYGGFDPDAQYRRELEPRTSARFGAHLHREANACHEFALVLLPA